MQKTQLGPVTTRTLATASHAKPSSLELVRELSETLRRIRHAPRGRTVVFAFKIHDWKRDFLRAAYPEYELVFVPFKHSAWLWHPIIQAASNKAFLCWGYKEWPSTASYARLFGIPLWRMEDGFVRSMGLGANHARPMSLVIDKTGTLYFDAREPSGLERLLAAYDFASDPNLLERARHCMQLLRRRGISKYNLSGAPSGRDLYDRYGKSEGRRPRILVIGQVESDASIQYGAPAGANNGRIVWEARRRNPEAQIFFRPHPDVLNDPRKIVTSLEEIENIAHVVTEAMPLHAALESIDEVYTITSLAGFEALLHGKAVVTWGSPFYAGWGLTKDLHPLARRTRQLSLEQVFAGAYLLYPTYRNPFSGEAMQLEDALELIDTGMSHRAARDAARIEANGTVAGSTMAPQQSPHHIAVVSRTVAARG